MRENVIEILNTDVIVEIETSSYDLDIENLMVFDYNYSQNKPSINSVSLAGNKSSAELGLAAASDVYSKEDAENKVVGIDENSTDTQYPSAKCVYDELLDKANKDLSDLSLIGQAVIDGKANTDLSNLTSSGNKVLDGQWVAIPYSDTTDAIVYNLSAPTSDTTKSLSSKLPNDGYIYEVLFVGAVTTGTTSGNQTRIILSSSEISSAANIYLVAAQTRSSSSITSYGSGIMPVGTNRNITICGYASNTGGISLYAIAYRRVGTNS